MLAELYEKTEQKRKKGLVEKLLLTGGKLAGGGIGSIAGSVVGAVYAVSKEICSFATTQQIYPLQSITLEYLSIVGALSLSGTFAGYYLTKKALNIFA
jgi:hypothetical protein